MHSRKTRISCLARLMTSAAKWSPMILGLVLVDCLINIVGLWQIDAQKWQPLVTWFMALSKSRANRYRLMGNHLKLVAGRWLSWMCREVKRPWRTWGGKIIHSCGGARGSLRFMTSRPSEEIVATFRYRFFSFGGKYFGWMSPLSQMSMSAV